MNSILIKCINDVGLRKRIRLHFESKCSIKNDKNWMIITDITQASTRMRVEMSRKNRKLLIYRYECVTSDNNKNRTPTLLIDNLTLPLSITGKIIELNLDLISSQVNGMSFS